MQYDESPSEVLKYLNVRPDGGASQKFSVKLIVDNQKKVKAQKQWYGNPLSEVIRIYDEDSKYDDEGEEKQSYYFSAKNLLRLDPETRVFTFKNEAGNLLTLTPAPAVDLSLNYDVLASSAMKDSSSLGVDADTVSFTEEERYKAMMDY